MRLDKIQGDIPGAYQTISSDPASEAAMTSALQAAASQKLLPPASGSPSYVKTNDGRLLEPTSVKTVVSPNPRNPELSSTRNIYHGAFDTFPKAMQDAMVQQLMSGNDDPLYSQEDYVRHAFQTPGKTLFAVTKMNDDATQTMIGVGAGVLGHGVTYDGDVHPIVYLQHLAAREGAGLQIANEVLAMADEHNAHLHFISLSPDNELPGGIYSAAKFAPDMMAVSDVVDEARRVPIAARLESEIRKEYGLPPNAKVDAGLPMTSAIGPFDKRLGHDDDALRKAFMPQLGNTPFHKLTVEDQHDWAVKKAGFGFQTDENGERIRNAAGRPIPLTHSDGSNVGQTPLLDWQGRPRLDRSGAPILTDAPTGTVTQMVKFTEHGPRHPDGTPLLVAIYYPSRGGHVISSGTASLSEVMGVRNYTGNPATAAEAQPDRARRPYRLVKQEDVLVPNSNRLARLGNTFKQTAGSVVAEHVLAPFGNSAVGQSALRIAASLMIGQQPPQDTKQAGIQARETLNAEETEPYKTRAGITPLNPDYGETRQGIEHNRQGGSDTTVVSPSREGLTFSVGTPTAVPAEYWVGAQGAPFGPPVPMDLIKPVQVAAGKVVDTAGKIGAGAMQVLDVSNRLAQLGKRVDAVKQTVGSAVAEHVIAPFGNGPVGQKALEVAAGLMIGQQPPQNAKQADTRPQTYATLNADQAAPYRMRAGITPLNPDYGETRQGIEHNRQGGSDTTIVSPSRVGLTFSVGTPTAVPAHYWVGARGGPFGPPLPMDLVLHPAITRPFQVAGKVVDTVGKIGGGVGAASLTLGLATHSIKMGSFMSGDPNLHGSQLTLDRIANEPIGMKTLYATADIPGLPKKFGAQASLFVGSMTQAYYQPALSVDLQGHVQRGIPQWIHVTDEGRVQVTSNTLAGAHITMGGLVTGARNANVAQEFIFMAPRFAVPSVVVTALPSKQNPALLDLAGGLVASTGSAVGLQVVSAGPLSYETGIMGSGGGALKAMVGTQAFKGSNLSVNGLLMDSFVSVAANPAYDPPGAGKTDSTAKLSLAAEAAHDGTNAAGN